MTADVSYDPRSGATAASVVHTTPAEVEQLVARAAAAAALVGQASPATRRAWLAAGADALVDNREELARIADWETALGWTRLDGEVVRAANQMRFYADVAVEGTYLRAVIDPATATTPFLARTNVPLGPVAVFGASNFPFAFSVFGNDTASAIAAGCPVVIKAHPAHPLTSQRTFEIVHAAMQAAGAPDGIAALVFGYETGTALVQHPAITAVAFTGSQAGGLSLWKLANQREVVVPVYAEMGTVNPVVITPAAGHDITAIADGFVQSFTMGSGQFCTKPGLLLAPRGSGATAAIAAALDSLAPEPVMLTSGIAASVTRGVAELQSAGATIAAQTPPAPGGWSSPAVLLSAPVDLLQRESRLLEECFGPVGVVVEYDDLDEALEAVDRLQGALAASIMIGEDDPDAASVLSRVERKVGRVIVNGWPTGVAFTWAQVHGGPWPATSSPATTSVGAAALDRFVRPVAYQGLPDQLLPPPLRADNPWGVPRRVAGVLQPGAQP
ncbi:aldehyde dehydrogenase family protein [Aeromicrobium wangtongii]|uniref:aldehyde dehydrogenase family protein n=1 Tax=Aeromicrobium wangtongii TaxID=2969247 RepID=UPI002017E9B3|nr:aldehyde dehydrogenase family protein [Aeromicrobium wangtongii]MCL3816966.1 aldehyde dehydrogenase family protein [Aeromicrobium wangtongii]